MLVRRLIDVGPHDFDQRFADGEDVKGHCPRSRRYIWVHVIRLAKRVKVQTADRQ